jgi:hypothetical protein
LVRRGGVVAFHDICGSGSTAPTASGAWVGGVPRYWNRVKALYQYRVFVRDPEQYGR